jgi:hypothetical protein
MLGDDFGAAIAFRRAFASGDRKNDRHHANAELHGCDHTAMIW